MEENEIKNGLARIREKLLSRDTIEIEGIKFIITEFSVSNENYGSVVSLSAIMAVKKGCPQCHSGNFVISSEKALGYDACCHDCGHRWDTKSKFLDEIYERAGKEQRPHANREPRIPELVYGCHVDVALGRAKDAYVYPECLLDTANWHDCTFAVKLRSLGKSKDDCKYWRKTNGEATGGKIGHDPNAWHEPIEKIRESSQGRIAAVCDEIKTLLLEKNRKYGNSALNPRRIFSKADTIEQLNIRIDDKLSRIATLDDPNDEDTEADLIGYLILRRVARGV